MGADIDEDIEPRDHRAADKCPAEAAPRRPQTEDGDRQGEPG